MLLASSTAQAFNVLRFHCEIVESGVLLSYDQGQVYKRLQMYYEKHKDIDVFIRRSQKNIGTSNHGSTAGSTQTTLTSDDLAMG
eukprot:292574-Hanusia_phi.AAC.2